VERKCPGDAVDNESISPIEKERKLCNYEDLDHISRRGFMMEAKYSHERTRMRSLGRK